MKTHKLPTEQILYLLEIESPDFPKYTTLILNLANRFSQGTRPKIVGQMSELIKQFKGREFEEWEQWYLKNHPEAIENATDRVMEMVENFQDAMTKIDRELAKQWVRDLVVVKTFIGLKCQKAILMKVAELEEKTWRLSSPDEESKGVDGYLGDEPVSIKPSSYKTMRELKESINARMIYYEKENDGVVLEY